MTTENTEVKRVLKKRGRKPKYTGDYTQEYLEYKRCRNCKRPTKGEEDFMNIKTGSRTKTCKRCRARVLKSYDKIKKPTQKEKLNALNKVLGLIHIDVIKTAVKDYDDLKPYLTEIMAN
jgi:hypothetical protein